MDARQLSALLERLGDADVREVDPSPPADAAIAAFVEGMGAPVTAKGYAQVLRRLARAWPAGTLDQLGVNDAAPDPELCGGQAFADDGEQGVGALV